MPAIIQNIIGIRAGISGDVHKVGGVTGITKIKEATKPIEYEGNEVSKEIVVYQVYKGDKLFREIEANNKITLYYD